MTQKYFMRALEIQLYSCFRVINVRQTSNTKQRPCQMMRHFVARQYATFSSGLSVVRLYATLVCAPSPDGIRDNNPSFQMRSVRPHSFSTNTLRFT